MIIHYFEAGDIIKIELNIKDKNIKFYVNGNDYGIEFIDIIIDERVFNLAVNFWESNQSVQLIKFERMLIK